MALNIRMKVEWHQEIPTLAEMKRVIDEHLEAYWRISHFGEPVYLHVPSKTFVMLATTLAAFPQNLSVTTRAYLEANNALGIRKLAKVEFAPLPAFMERP